MLQHLEKQLGEERKQTALWRQRHNLTQRLRHRMDIKKYQGKKITRLSYFRPEPLHTSYNTRIVLLSSLIMG